MTDQNELGKRQAIDALTVELIQNYASNPNFDPDTVQPTRLYHQMRGLAENTVNEITNEIQQFAASEQYNHDQEQILATVRSSGIN